MKTKAVYTAIIGDYDTLLDPLKVNPDWDYICFTNNPNLKSDIWQIRTIDEGLNSSVWLARQIKILPHVFLKHYEVTIWVDGNMHIVNDVTQLYEKYKKFNFTAISHPNRKCIFQEAKAVIKLKKDAVYIVEKQMQRYKNEGMPNNYGLIESGFLIRKNHKSVNELCDAWMKEVSTYSHRDQLSFDYCRWKMDLIVNFIGVGQRRLYVELKKHGKKVLYEAKKEGFDVVYPLGKGSHWEDNELRFSIRSFVKHFKQLRNIVVIGHKPTWLKNAIHIPTPDDMNYRDGNIIKKLLIACNCPEVSDRFIWCADDKFINADMTMEDFTGWYFGEIPKRKSDENEWHQWKQNTMEELEKRNFPTKDYNCAHAPQPIDKIECIDVFKKWDWVNNFYTGSNIYNNCTEIFKGVDASEWHVKIKKELSHAELILLMDNCKSFNVNNISLNYAMMDTFQQIFPQKSEYEIWDTVGNAYAEYSEWLESGRDYAQGVELIIKHTRNTHLVKHLLKKGKTPGSQKTLERNLHIISRKWKN